MIHWPEDAKPGAPGSPKPTEMWFVWSDLKTDLSGMDRLRIWPRRVVRCTE
jgi:hypothetical protein